MTHWRTHSRREFLQRAGGAGIGLAMASGAGAATTNEGSDRTPDIKTHEAVTYAEREAGDLELDLAVPDVENPPLVVWLHGGGWMVRTRKNRPDFQTYFASEGYAMASISYRLSTIPDGVVPYLPVDSDNPTPRGTFPDHLLDVRAAVRWLRANSDRFGYDAANVALWGASSGGHLASLAGVVDDVRDVAGEVYPDSAVSKAVHPDQSGRVQAVIARYPAVDFLAMDPQRERIDVPPLFPPHDLPDSAESIMIGGGITENEAKVERANPLTYASSGDPPFLISQGMQDQFLPYIQSRQLFEALQQAGVEATLYELPDRGHGYRIDAFASDPPDSQSVRSTDGHDAESSGHAGDPYGPAAVERFLDEHLDP